MFHPPNHFWQRGNLAVLLRQAECTSPVQEWLHHYLAVDIRPHCQVLSFNEGVLSLELQHSSLATRFRYQLPILEQDLKKAGFVVSQIQLRIQVPVVTPAPSQDPTRVAPGQLSAKSAQLLENTAEGLEEGALKNALLRLAKERDLSA